MVRHEWIQNFRKRIQDHLSISYDESLYNAKIEEAKHMKFIHKDTHYKSLVFNEINVNVLDSFDVEIEFCETPEQHDLWEYFRVHTSSIRTKKNVGRLIRILVKHKDSQKYIGILSLSSDIYACQPRDKYIGLDTELRKTKLNYIMNISTCVGLQPFAYNYNVGKLLVALCFSKEVHDKIKDKYGHNVACITTFAINGKSVQYDRIPQYLKYVGETQGYAMTNIPDKLYKSCVRYLEHVKDHKTLGYQNRMYKINKVLSYLDIVPEDSQKRGVYVGFTSPDSTRFMNDVIDSFDIHVEPAQRICDWWKQRWALQRFIHLSKENRLKYNIEFHNAWKTIVKERVKKCIDKKKELVGEEVYNAEKMEYMRSYRYQKIELKQIPEQPINVQWLAGFMDGDGCIEYVNGYIRISIGQCNPKPLLICYARYGGCMRVSKNTGEKSRVIFKWELVGEPTDKFLNDVKDHVILEKNRVDAALNNKVLVPSQKKLWNHDLAIRLNDSYIAGFFDAEGEVDLHYHSDKINASYSLRITQKSCTDMLKAIQAYFGYGSVDKARYNVYSIKNICLMVSSILPYSIVKDDQLKLLLGFLDNKTDLHETIDKIRADKHKIYNIDDYIKNIFKVKKQIVKKPKYNDEASEQNDDKEMSYNHRLNIKYATSKAKHEKRKVSDEQIHAIRKRHVLGETMTKIADDLGLSRQYVSDIVHKHVLTLDEIESDQLKETLDSKINTNIAKSVCDMDAKEWGIMKSAMAKRKVQPLTMLKVMEIKLKESDRTPSEILTLIKKEDPNITIDMVKNYIKGKVCLFKPEFPIQNYSWDSYVDMKQSLSS